MNGLTRSPTARDLRERVAEQVDDPETADQITAVLSALGLSPEARRPEVIVTDKAELRAVLQELITQTMLEQVPEAIRRANLPEWLSREQAKQRYGLSNRQLTYLRNERRIEYSQHGRTIFYRRASLDAYFEEGRVPAREDD